MEVSNHLARRLFFEKNVIAFIQLFTFRVKEGSCGNFLDVTIP